MVVSARQPVQGYVTVNVEATLDSSLVLLDPPPRLQALVVARAVDLVKLVSEPPVVQRKIEADVPDTVVLDLGLGDVRFPTDLSEHVRVLDLQPRVVTLRFEARATRRVAVVSDARVMVKTDSSLVGAERLTFEPATVRITGPRRLVRQISGVHPFSLTIARGDTMPHLADLDTSGLGVHVIPSQVKVTVRR